MSFLQDFAYFKVLKVKVVKVFVAQKCNVSAGNDLEWWVGDPVVR